MFTWNAPELPRPSASVFLEDKLGGGDDNEGGDDSASLSWLRSTYPILGRVIDAYQSGGDAAQTASLYSSLELSELCNLWTMIHALMPDLARFLALLCHAAVVLSKQSECGEGNYWNETLQRCVNENYGLLCNNGVGIYSEQGQCVLCPKGQSIDEATSQCRPGCPPHMFLNAEHGCIVNNFNQGCITDDGKPGVVTEHGWCYEFPDCGDGERYDMYERKCLYDVAGATEEECKQKGMIRRWIPYQGYLCVPPCGENEYMGPEGSCICLPGTSRPADGGPCEPEQDTPCDPPWRHHDKWGCVSPGYNSPCTTDEGHRGVIGVNGYCGADICPEGSHFDFEEDGCVPDDVSCEEYGPGYFPYTTPSGETLCVTCREDENFDKSTGYCLCPEGKKRQIPNDPESPCVPAGCSEFGPQYKPWVTPTGNYVCVECHADEVVDPESGFCICPFPRMRQNPLDPSSPCIQEVGSTGGADPGRPPAMQEAGPPRSATQAPLQDSRPAGEPLVRYCTPPSIFDPLERRCVAPPEDIKVDGSEAETKSGPSTGAIVAGVVLLAAAGGLFAATLAIQPPPKVDSTP